MTPLRDALASIAPALRKLHAKFALVGGLAVSARTEPRFTRDIDLAVTVPGDKEAEAIVHGLRAAGYEPVARLEQEATGRLATVRLQAGGATGAVVDLLFASSQDRADALTLLAAAGARDLDETRGALVVIEQRGYARKRDLQQELERLIGESRG